MQFHDFINKIDQELKSPLPGPDFHLKMMNQARANTRSKPNEFTRRSAVLILFFPKQSGVHVPLILRPAYDGVHGGQMAFPGGREEKEDENLIRTALREAQEEIGIKAIDVKILGQLTEIFIPPSNFFVLPVIGFVNYQPEFYPDAREVDEIFEIHLNEFLDEKNVQVRKVNVRGLLLETPCFVINERIIWGATAMMLAELVEILKR
ncbi:MAG: NUDIX hydrolase [Spirosomataceae bacterium]